MRLAIGGTMATFHGRFARRPFDEDEIVRAVRRRLVSDGVDPDRHPPVSEMLGRRILEGEEFPRRSEAEDLCALLMLKTLAPWSVMASCRLKPPLAFRLGREGESLPESEGAAPVTGWPVLADAAGAVASPLVNSGLPHAEEEDEVLLVCYQPSEVAETVAAKVHLARFVVMTWAFRFLEEKSVTAGR